MADSVKVTNLPDSGSRERVAFDLMHRIALGESGTQSREYYFDLYSKCFQIVGGVQPGHVK